MILPSIKYALSIVIPVYNESENVEALAEEIMHSLPLEEYQYEIIFVDDASADNTLQTLQALCLKKPQVKVISHDKNYGQSAGLISGAKIAQYPWIITLDGDGQNDPADIPLLFGELEKAQPSSVIFGHRQKRNDNLVRRLSSRLGNSIRQMLLKDNCPDTGCSLKLFPREAFLELPRFNHVHRFLPALFKRSGFTIINIPVNHRPRLHGVSKYGIKNRLWTGILDVLGVMWLLRRPCNPKIK